MTRDERKEADVPRNYSSTGLLVLFASALFSHSAELEIVGVQIMPTPQHWADSPNSPHGGVQISPSGTENICCLFDETKAFDCVNYDGPYVPGDTLALNTYWTDTLDGTQSMWDVEWTLGISVPSVILLFEDSPVSFGDLTGLEGDFTFCVAGLLTLPPESDGFSVDVGHGVTSPTGTLPPGLNGSQFTIDTDSPPSGTCFSDFCCESQLFLDITLNDCLALPGSASWRAFNSGGCLEL